MKTIIPLVLSILAGAILVWEWVQDWYHARYYAQSPESDPQGPTAGEYRVARGGSALSDARSARVSSRRYVGPQASTDYYGLRVVREATR